MDADTVTYISTAHASPTRHKTLMELAGSMSARASVSRSVDPGPEEFKLTRAFLSPNGWLVTCLKVQLGVQVSAIWRIVGGPAGTQLGRFFVGGFKIMTYMSYFYSVYRHVPLESNMHTRVPQQLPCSSL